MFSKNDNIPQKRVYKWYNFKGVATEYFISNYIFGFKFQTKNKIMVPGYEGGLLMLCATQYQGTIYAYVAVRFIQTYSIQ